MKWKTILVLLVAAIAIGAGVISYFYYKEPADIRKSETQIETTAAALLADFVKDEAAANARYLDKVVTVKGNVSKVNVETGNPAVFLDTGDATALVTCSFYDTEIPHLKKLQNGQSIKIKGVCTGILMDVVLNKCSIVP